MTHSRLHNLFRTFLLIVIVLAIGISLCVSDAFAVNISGGGNLPNGTTINIAVGSTKSGVTATTNSSGDFTLSNVTISSGSIVTVWADNVGESSESTAVTKYDGSGNITGMVLNTKVLTVGSDDNTNLVGSDFGLYDNNDDEDIIQTYDSGVVTWKGDFKYDVSGNGNANLGNVIVGTKYIDISTITHITGTKNNGGSYRSQTQATFADEDTFWVSVDTGANIIAFKIQIDLDTANHKIGLKGINDGYKYIGSSLDNDPSELNIDFDSNGGIGSFSAYNIKNITIHFSNGDSVEFPNYNNDSTFLTLSYQYTGELNRNATLTLKSNFNAKSLIVRDRHSVITDGYDMDVGTFITMKGTLDAENGTGGDSAISLGTTWKMDGGEFIETNSTVVFDGTSDGSQTGILQLEGSVLNNLTVDSGGRKTTLADALEIDGSLKIVSGTLDVSGSGHKITMGGSWINTGGSFVSRTGMVEFNGVDKIESNGSAFYEVVVDVPLLDLSTITHITGTKNGGGSYRSQTQATFADEDTFWVSVDIGAYIIAFKIQIDLDTANHKIGLKGINDGYKYIGSSLDNDPSELNIDFDSNGGIGSFSAYNIKNITIHFSNGDSVEFPNYNNDSTNLTLSYQYTGDLAEYSTMTLKSDFSAKSLIIKDGDSLITDGYDMDMGTFITMKGTLDAENGTGGDSVISLGTTWTMDDGNFIKTNSTVVFDGTSEGSQTGILQLEGSVLNNLTVDSEGRKTTLADALDIDGVLRIVSGTLDVSGSNYKVSLGGSWLNSGGSFVSQTGLVEFNGEGKVRSNNQNFYNVTMSSGAGDSTLLDDMTVAGDLTVDGGKLISGGNTLRVFNADVKGNELKILGNWESTGANLGNEKLDFSGSGTSTMNSTESDDVFVVTEFDLDGFTGLMTLGMSLDVEGTFKSGTGVLDLSSYNKNINIASTVTIRGSVMPTSGVVTLDGDFKYDVSGNGNANFGNVVVGKKYIDIGTITHITGTKNGGGSYRSQTQATFADEDTFWVSVDTGANIIAFKIQIDLDTVNHKIGLKGINNGYKYIGSSLDNDPSELNIDFDSNGGIGGFDAYNIKNITIHFSNGDSVEFPNYNNDSTNLTLSYQYTGGLNDSTTLTLKSNFNAKSLIVRDRHSVITDGYDMDVGTFITMKGTLDAGNGTGGNSAISLGTTWKMDGGEFIETNSTVVFDGTSEGSQTGILQLEGSVLNNLTVDSGGRKTTLADALEIDGSLKIVSGTLDVSGSAHKITMGGSWINTGGSFVSRTGMVEFNGVDKIESNGSAFYEVVVDVPHTGGLAEYSTMTLKSDFSAKSLIIKDGDSLITDGYDMDMGTFITMKGTLNAGNGTGGDSVISLGTTWKMDNGKFIKTNSTVVFDGTSEGSQTGILQLEGSVLNNLTVDSEGRKTTLADALDIDGVLRIVSGTLDVSGSNYGISLAGSWFNEGGSFKAKAGTVTLDGTKQKIDGEEVFFNLSKTRTVADTLYFGVNDIVTVKGLARLKGSSGNLLSLRSETDGVSWHLNAKGTRDIGYVDVKDGVNDQSGFFIEPPNSTDSLNNVKWFGLFLSAVSDLTGSVDVSVARNSILTGDTTVMTNGSFTMDVNGQESADDIFTIWADGVADNGESTGVTKYDGTGNITGMVLNEGVLTVGSDDNTSLTVSDLGTYDNDQDEDIMHTYNGTILDVDDDDVYTSDQIEIKSGTTLTIAANDLLEVHDVDNNGTLTLSGTAEAMIDGSWDNDSGATFNSNSSQVMFIGSNGSSETITSNGDAFNDVYFNDGLVYYWRLDEASANTCQGGVNDACDSSGFKQDGTWNGDPQASTDVPNTNYENRRSLEFDGTGDYVDVGTLDYDFSSGFSMCMWTQWDTLVDSGRIIDFAVGQANNNIIISGVGTTTDLRFLVYDGNSVSGTATATDVIDVGTWQYICGSYNGSGTIKLFVDGVLEGTQTGITMQDVDLTSNYIGKSNWDTAYFDGHIDDVRVYNRALSTTEIGRLANGNTPLLTDATYSLSDDLDVDGDLWIHSGKLDVSGNDITLAGSWNNTGGVFDEETQTVTLDGGNQTIGYNEDFYDLSKNVTTASILTIGQSVTIGVAGDFDLSGQTNQLLSVKSSKSGSRHVFNIGVVGQAVAYLNLTDSHISGNNVIVQVSTDGSGNDDEESSPHWIFSSIFYWIGNSGGNTNDTSNWSFSSGGACGSGGGGVGVPQADTIITFQDSCDNNALINTKLIVKGFVMKSGYTGTIELGNDLEVNGDLSIAGGALDVSSNNYTIVAKGEWLNSGGNFISQSGTVKFDGQGGRIESNGKAFYNMVLGNARFTLADTLDVDGDLILMQGTLDVSNNGYKVTVGKSWLNNGGEFVSQEGTVEFKGGGGKIEADSDRFYDVKFGGGKFTLGDTLNVEEGIKMQGGGELDVSSDNYKVKVGGTWLNSGGGFVSQEGTVEFKGGGGGIDADNDRFYDVKFRGGKFTLGDTFNVERDMSLESGGTLDVSSSSYKVIIGNSWMNSGGSFVSQGGTVEFDGSGKIRANNQEFNDVEMNGQTISLASSVSMKGDLRILQGSLDVSGSDYKVTVGRSWMNTVEEVLCRRVGR